MLIEDTKYQLIQNKEYTFNHSVINSLSYLDNYKNIIPRYIANGAASSDTLEYYFFHIDSFLNWCMSIKRNPLTFTDYEIRGFQTMLYDKYAINSVSLKIAAIKVFYKVAKLLGLIAEDPTELIHCTSMKKDDTQFTFYTTSQIGEMIKKLSFNDDFTRLRNTVIIYLMAVEGLRAIEVHRLNVNDIDFENKTISVKGKGHRGRINLIYPCNETLHRIQEYLNVIPERNNKEILTPLILSNSHNNSLNRIGRVGLRYIVNKILNDSGYKKKGAACHSLRHSCGTNLYAETKDLRLVQETLRHSDPTISARYAHVHERTVNRPTKNIVPKI